MKKLILLFICIAGLVNGWAQPAGWSHTQPLTVTENSGSNVYNYQLKITFDSQSLIVMGLMQPTCDDLRFGTLCDQANLNYWIESGINTPITTVWVKIDTLLANQTQNFYMFFGNPSATSASGIPGVFEGPHSSTDSVASGGAGGATNSQRGFRFTPNVDVLVTHFGKREPNGTTRYVTLFDFATQAILQQIQVGGPAAQYSYANIPNPFWLVQGTQYVLELYQGASDGYYFGTSSQIGQHLTYGDMRYCNSCTENTFPTSTLSNYHYGYPDLWYWTKSNITPAPTYGYGVAPSVNLGPDNNFCGNTLLDAGNPGSDYVWNTGDTTQTVSVDSSGTYSVTITTAQNCQAVDTINIVIDPVPSVDLGPDSSYCDNVILDAGSGFANYLWSNTDTTQTINVTGTGIYSVVIEAINGCTNGDTIDIVIHSLPTVTFALAEDTVCVNYSPIALTTGSPAGGLYTGTGVSSGNFDPGTGVGNYLITYTYTDANGCTNTDVDNISVIGCTGLEGMNNISMIIYPNPNNGAFYIDCSSVDENSLVHVYDVLGKLVYSSPLQNSPHFIQLDVKPGTYILQLFTGKGSAKQKLIVK